MVCGYLVVLLKRAVEVVVRGLVAGSKQNVGSKYYLGSLMVGCRWRMRRLRQSLAPEKQWLRFRLRVVLVLWGR